LGLGYTLSGGASPSDPIYVDEHLDIYVNGSRIVNHQGPNQFLGPYTFGGDDTTILRVKASNGTPFRSGLSPLYLHDADTSVKLSNGSPEMGSGFDDPAPGGVFFDSSWVVGTALATGQPLPDSDGAYASVRIVAGTLNNQRVSWSQPSIQVEAGETITGLVTIRTSNTYTPGAVVPLGMHWSWDQRGGAKQLISSDIPSTSTTWVAPVNFVAPDVPGEYWIVFASNAEFNLDQVFSCTNWQVGQVIWNDGNDLFDLSPRALLESSQSGVVTVGNYQFPTSANRISKELVGCAAIKVLVTKIPDAGNPIGGGTPIPASNTKVVLYTHGWNTSQSDFTSGSWEALDTGIRDAIPLGSGWTVVGYDWTSDSCPIVQDPELLDIFSLYQALTRVPGCARLNAIDHGRALGQALWNNGYREFHLIAHSAGAWLIDEAFRTLRRIAKENSTTIRVQLTFLDAFTPFGTLGPEDFGVDDDGKSQNTDPKHIIVLTSPRQHPSQLKAWLQLQCVGIGSWGKRSN
jgi:hypothetical protein